MNKNYLLSIMLFCCFTLSGAIFGPILTNSWYPQDHENLTATLNGYFAIAHNYLSSSISPASIKALIVPHAGYAYSGFCAGTVFGALLDRSGQQIVKNRQIKRVIVLAPSHSGQFDYVALPNFSIYKTVLGEIPLDRVALKKLQKHGVFKIFGEVFAKEHSVEIELPFLQKTIQKFMLVPLIIGSVNQADIDKIVRALREIITANTLVVVSSDFVHHGQNYGYQKFTHTILDQVRQIDSQAVQALDSQSLADFNRVIEQTGATICGRDPIRILLGLMASGVWGALEPRLLCYYMSAQTDPAGFGEINKLFSPIPDEFANTSVSYVGMVFTTEKLGSKKLIDRLTGYEKRALLALARRSIENQFAEPGKKLQEELLYPIASQGLSIPAGAFVTLKTKNGDLRGCIGRIETTEPLYKTVLHVAQDAAFRDNRFNPLTVSELDQIVLDISVLEPPVAIKSWKEIVVGKHGVILSRGPNSAVFLPQVALEQGWDVPTMLSNLARKAGLPADSWRDAQTTFRVFEGCEISE